MTTMQKLISPAASNEPVLSFKDVSSEYVRRKDHFIALRHIEFSLHRGEILALIGPSGCGKTTLMKVLLGTQDYGGDILLRGADIETIPLSRRGIAYIPQKNPLFPFLDVFSNIAFPLRSLHVDEDEIKKTVASAAEELGISLLLPRRIGQLSLGQQQKAALAKALCAKSDLFLFDESFAAVNPQDKVELWKILRNFAESKGTSILFATHDLAEATAVSDRVIVMMDGSIRQIGSPMEIATHPVDADVRSFFSSQGGFHV